MVDVARARKLAVRIREIVASTIELQVKDPRLGMVTITDAKVTPDLREATLYYTVYGSDEERQSSAMALESAKGVLRSQVGRQTGVRYTPSLTFVADVVPETAGKIEELLAKARAADAELHALAEGAQPAGDPDPYRLPRAVDDGEADAAADRGADEDVAAEAHHARYHAVEADEQR
ncbi:MAG TPA: 30S ribosome-binding factor RbfA [Mycobacteriales bacterium]|nr:30S ribosome-binding factor RbfA [Mycobacteriales bacterium]